MDNHAPQDYVCPFCSLIEGVENESVHSRRDDFIFQDDTVIAIVSSHQWPNTPGNVLIIPREHHENIYDLPQHLGAHVQRVARLVALTMKEVYRCDGVSTRQHNEPAGNQDVWHYHVHVTPRYQGDDFYRTRREFMGKSQDTPQLAVDEWSMAL